MARFRAARRCVGSLLALSWLVVPAPLTLPLPPPLPPPPASRYVLSHDPVTPQDRQISLLETMEVNVDDMKAHLELLGGYLIGVPDMVPGLQTEAPASGVAPAPQAAIRDAPAGGAGDHTATAGFGPVTGGGGAANSTAGAGGGVGGAPAGGGGGAGAAPQGTAVTPVGVDGLRRRKRRDSFVSNGDWVTDIRDTMTIMTERLSVLATDMEDLQVRRRAVPSLQCRAWQRTCRAWGSRPRVRVRSCTLQAAVARSTKVTYARLDKLEAAVVHLSTLAGTQSHVGIDAETPMSLRSAGMQRR